MRPVPFRMIVFDCDGVLLESVDVKTRAFAALFAEHGPEVSREAVRYHLANGGVSRYAKFAYLYERCLERRITDEEMAELDRRFSELVLTGVLESPTVPGAVEFLAAYHTRVPLFVASGTPEHELRHILDQRGLSRYFHAVYGSPRSKRNILGDLLAKQAVPPGQCLMVGDASTDLEAALANGMAFLGRGPVDPNRPWLPDLTGMAAYLQTVADETEPTGAN